MEKSKTAKSMGRVRKIFPILTAGFIIALLDIFVEISLAAMIFSGNLSIYVGRGVGFMLFGAMILSVVTVIFTSFPAMVTLPQDAPAAILALTAAAITAHLTTTTSGENIFTTVVAAIMLSSLLTGLCFLILGQFKLGGLARYIPYPVFGGFLAGTGWLLVQGGMGLLVGNLPFTALFSPAKLLFWLPAVLFAILLTLLLRRHNHFLIVPGALLAMTGLFYGLLWLNHLTIAEATAQGWLLGPFPSGGLWQPLSLAAMGHIAWPAIAKEAGNIGTLILISVISLLLNASGIEVTTQTDVDLNRELKGAGIANCLAGLAGGAPGYPTLSLSLLGPRIGVNSRAIGLSVAVINGAILVFGAAVLSYLPRPLLGGLLIFLGLGFLIEWLYDGWQKLTKTDYAIVCLIMVVMSGVGVLEGVGLGVLTAVGLFVFNYSRTPVIRHALSRVTYHSTVVRPRLHQQLLGQKGDWVYILKLQGFIFFGTANSLLEHIRARLQATDRLKPRFIVLDMRYALGLDASAEIVLMKLKQLAQAQGIVLVFTHLTPRIRQRLERSVFAEVEGNKWRAFDDLDRGVEWCEEQMIQTFDSVGLVARPKTVKQQLEAFLPKSGKFIGLFEYLEQEDTAASSAPAPQAPAVTQMLSYMERRDVPAGHMLIQQGEKTPGLYFVESGRVTVQVTQADGHAVRVRTMEAGTIVGETGLYLGAKASAAVVADIPGTLYFLSASNLQRMENEAPALAAAFHKFVAQHLSERLAETTEIVQALLD
ncbi:MAG: SulP family inorganic anion transporter [Anaerolineae bacterium]